MSEPASSLRGAVPATYVRVLWEYLEAQGRDAEVILGEPAPSGSDISPGRFPVTRWKALLERAAVALDAPDLGLALGQTLTARHFGVIGYVLLACENLATALQRLERYQRLVYDVSPMRLLASQGSLTLEWGTESGRPGRLVDETAITALVQLARDLTGSRTQIEHVQFVNPAPANLSAFRDFFGGDVLFGQATTQVRLPLSLLAMPLRQADRALRTLLEHQADALLEQLPEAGDLEQAVRRAVTRMAGEGELSLVRIAKELHLAPRTLHRRLSDLGLSFRGLRDDTLRRLAEQHLSDRGLSVAEVAQLLGYSEQSAFTRAFKRWTGRTPLDQRRGPH